MTDDEYNSLLASRDRLITEAKQCFSGSVTAGMTKIEGQIGLALIFNHDPLEAEKNAFTAKLGQTFEGYPYKFMTVGTPFLQ